MLWPGGPAPFVHLYPHDLPPSSRLAEDGRPGHPQPSAYKTFAAGKGFSERGGHQGCQASTLGHGVGFPVRVCARVGTSG